MYYCIPTDFVRSEICIVHSIDVKNVHLLCLSTRWSCQHPDVTATQVIGWQARKESSASAWTSCTVGTSRSAPSHRTVSSRHSRCCRHLVTTNGVLCDRRGCRRCSINCVVDVDCLELSGQPTESQRATSGDSFDCLVRLVKICTAWGCWLKKRA